MLGLGLVVLRVDICLNIYLNSIRLFIKQIIVKILIWMLESSIFKRNVSVFLIWNFGCCFVGLGTLSSARLSNN